MTGQGEPTAFPGEPGRSYKTDSNPQRQAGRTQSNARAMTGEPSATMYGDDPQQHMATSPGNDR